MSPLHRTLLVVAGSLLAGMPAHAAALALINADFEAGPRPANGAASPGHFVSLPGWSGGSGTQVWNPSEAQLRNADAHGIVAGIPTYSPTESGFRTQTSSTMWSQVVPDVLLAANTRYTLTLEVATDNSFPTWAYDFGLISGNLADGAGFALARATGKTDIDGSIIPTAQFRTVNLVFETGADTLGIGRQFAIGLSGRGASNQRIAYDNIRLDATSLVSDVPEPATWAMFISGFGLIGGAMRRRPSIVRRCA